MTPVDWKRQVQPVWKPDAAAKKQPKGLAQRSKRKQEADKQLDEITPFLLERCKGRCEAKTPVCTGGAEHRHHALRRPHTAGLHDAETILYVCFRCHSHIHANPEIAYANGWLVRNGAA